MSNENGQAPFDEWVTTFNNDIRLQMDWDKKRIKGAEVRGAYIRFKDFTREVWDAVSEMVHRGRLAYEYLDEESE
jgi:hypothetical protein